MKPANLRSATTRRQFISQMGTLGLTAAAMRPAAAFGQSTRAAPRGTLRVAYGAIGSSRHPQSSQISPDDDIMNVIFDPVLKLAGQGRIEPVLAREYRQVSDTRWRFALRSGVRFHDGSPLTSADVKFSMENFQKPGFNSYLYSWLDRVETIDDLTVEVVTKEPSRIALVYMAYYSHVLPRTATDPKTFVQRLTGTGPYRFVEAIPNDRVVVEAHRDFWGQPKPHFQRIVFRQIPENGPRVAALQAGEVDIATNVPVDDIERLRRAGLRVKSVPSNRVMYVWFNQNADGPWKDVRVRQAVIHAIDRDAIRAALLKGLGANMEGPFARGTMYFNRELPRYNYDPAKARQLLAASGYPNGFQTKIVTSSGRYLKDREIAEVLAGQLESIGVRLEVVPLEWATFLQQVRTERQTTGKQYGLILAAWGNVPADAFFGMRQFEPGDSYNLGGYANGALKALLDQGKVTFDDAKLRAIYGRAQELFWQDAPVIPLFELPITIAFSSKLRGFEPRSDEMNDLRPVAAVG